jgi:hypothetical protein
MIFKAKYIKIKLDQKIAITFKQFNWGQRWSDLRLFWLIFGVC